MGEAITITLDARVLQGKKVARLRKEGIVPGVIYGHGIEPQLVQSPYNVIERVVSEAGYHTPVHLTLDGKNRIAMIKDVERDPVKARITHVSLHAVKANEVVTAEVPIELADSGESDAEKAGLVILQAIESIEIKAKPAVLPSSLTISVRKLKTDEDKLTLADIVLPAGVEFADAEQDVELTVASVYEPAALEAANNAVGGDATEESAEDVPTEHGEGEENAK